MTPFNLVTFLIGTLFLFGMLTSIAGILILTFRASSSEVKTIAAQTVRLAQKGLAEDVAGLVGNATNLVDAINQLVRTNRGVGIFLVVIGLVMMGIAAWLALQVYQISP
ncbi:MAG: hypothetical protein B6D39_08305 [Anaerolineae bacterium UTCFX2]|jgi:hypothetical protein|nr:hypothetical protein [Anaerolineae bacterium]MCZ7553031.1 hypothetical protein [Anaerolineales bacterium]OQY90382.1 MAG: hypothetical protein B6D39_08305 [Anaerolineae bacterium UTCFX2]